MNKPISFFKKHSNKIKLGLFLSFFFVLPFACCKKEDKVEPDYCELHPDECAPISEAKEFFLFKQGSWWVYEEETSHERDSVYVTECSPSNSNSYDFDARYYSTHNDYFYHFFPSGYAAGSPNCIENKPVKTGCLYLRRSKYKPGEFIYEDYCFFYNCNTGDKIYCINFSNQNNQLKINDVYKNYELNNLNFSKTIIIHEDYTAIEINQPTIHYYSKGVGLIRKELLDSNQVWNLVNYHIEG